MLNNNYRLQKKKFTHETAFKIFFLWYQRIQSEGQAISMGHEKKRGKWSKLKSGYAIFWLHNRNSIDKYLIPFLCCIFILYVIVHLLQFIELFSEG